VYIFPLTEDNKIYLVKQYRYNLETDVLEGVAGYVEKNELPLDAAKRELREETGLTADEWKKLPSMKVGAGVIHSELHFFVAKGLHAGNTQFDEGEEIELVKMPFGEAIEKVLSGEIAIVPSAYGILAINTLKERGQL
jgi:ADP-ribose pyrophosphatase